MFQTLNTKFTTDSVVTDIQNLEVSSEHWRSTTNIIKIVEELELILCKVDRFIDAERELIMFLLTINKQNSRIQDMKFFTMKDPPTTLVCMCVSDITTFKSENFLKRNIIIDLRKQNKRLLFTDITAGEWKQLTNVETGKCLPPTWQANELLTKKYNKLKDLFLV